jgi:zinc-ribbon domain
MNTCSYCGRQFSPDAVHCPECGTPLDTTLGPTPNPRADIRSVLVQTCSTEMEANVAVRVLESAGIASLVMVDDCGGMLQPISAAKGFRVMVRTRFVAL